MTGLRSFGIGAWSSAGGSQPSAVATLAAASMFDDPGGRTGYHASRNAYAGCTLYGAYLTLGTTDYVWWSHDDGTGTYQGHDPGLSIAGLAGMTGHEVQLASGSQTASQVATATATVIGAIGGFSCTPSADNVNVVGTDTLGTGTGFAARGAAGSYGSTGFRIDGTTADGSTWYTGGLTGMFMCSFTTSAGSAKRVVAVDVRLGTNVNTSTAVPRVALYAGGTSDTDPDAATLVHDFGQIPTSVMSANTWLRLYVPSSVYRQMAASTRHWLAIKCLTADTHLNFENHAAVPAYGGDLNDLVNITAGTSEDEADAYDSTLSVTSTVDGNYSWCARVIYDEAPFRSDGTVEFTWGLHVSASNLASTTDIDNLVANATRVPNVYGMEIVSGSITIASHPASEEFRFGVFQGGSDADPLNPNPNGATVTWDAGQTAGTATGWYDFAAPAATSLSPDVLTIVMFKSDNSTNGINVAFAANGALESADPEDDPMDFVRPTLANNGPEIEWTPVDPIPGGTDEHDTDPAVAFESPLVWGGVMTNTRPGNIPGLRLRIRTTGISV